jgi:hypothetical protein
MQRVSSRRRASIAYLSTIALVETWLVAPEPASATIACDAPLVVGARGSGEAPGLGDTVDDAVGGFQSTYGRPTDVVALQYPATSISAAWLVKPWRLGDFAASVSDGIDELSLVLQIRAVECPNQAIVIFGYSQGALVVNQTLQRFAGARPDIVARIAAVGLLSDPARLGGSTVNTGNASPKLDGIAVSAHEVRKQDLPSTVRPVVESVCFDGDAVCAYSNRALSTVATVHASYKDAVARAVGASAARRLPHPVGDVIAAVRRPSGSAGFTTIIDDITCPPGTDEIVGRGRASRTVVYPYGWYPGFTDYVDLVTDMTMVAGTYDARLECRDGGFDHNPDSGDVLGTLAFVQTVTGLPNAVVVEPASVRPGESFTVSDGGGCDPYTAAPQAADVQAMPIGGGSPTLRATVEATTSGRWGPVPFTMPQDATPQILQVWVNCRAADGTSSTTTPVDLTIVT